MDIKHLYSRDIIRMISTPISPNQSYAWYLRITDRYMNIIGCGKYTHVSEGDAYDRTVTILSERPFFQPPTICRYSNTYPLRAKVNVNNEKTDLVRVTVQNMGYRILISEIDQRWYG